MEWNEDTIARLRMLWAEGHSTAEIGRRMAVSKNAVVGKAHRLGLAARPSPIRRDGSGAASARPAAPRRSVGPTLPPLPAGPADPREVSAAILTESNSAAPIATIAVRAAIAVATAPLVASQKAVTPVAAAPAVRVMPAPRAARHAACCWPIGEPGTKTFRFCDDEALSGKPYCNAHAQLAYVKVRDRREEAA
jgi:GcrA cell cycle regulator